MKIKVCGMRNPENILAVAELKPDYMGFIFYEKSPRYVLKESNIATILNLPKSIKKIGVFVSANFDEILDKINEFTLDAVQIYSNNDEELCTQIRRLDIEVVKVFSVDNSFDFTETEKYLDLVDYFLFDTKGENYGGHGTTFDWKILDKYSQKVPFFLAGGISIENLPEIKKLNQYNLAGIDVNSKFEISPGLKDIEKLKTLFKAI